MNATHTSLIEAIATKADRKAATAARRGKPNKGLFASFGKLDQRAFGIEYPNTVTATHRAKMIAVLRSRGYTVSEHTSTDRKGNEKFLSLKVVAEAL